MKNAFPPQQTEYRGMVPEDRPLQAVSHVDCSVPRERGSQLSGLQQQDVYSNDAGVRWPMSGRDHHEPGNFDASFRSQYCDYDEPAGADAMWPSQQNEEARPQNILLSCGFLKDVYWNLVFCVVTT